MAANYKVPPKFDETRPYECWKNEVNVWKRITELDKKKQALAIALGLEGRAREIAMEISADQLDQDDGMETLLAKLDGVFLREEKDRTYEAYSHFDRISKDSSVSMEDYIIDFEQRYNRMKKYNMALPDAVLAFKLLDTACLDRKDRQLALTACTELTFTSMKSALKRIFGGKPGASSAIQLNQEAAFLADQRPVKGRRNTAFPSGQQRTPLPGTNPLDKFGKRSRCAVCQSTYHWARDCPHKKNEQVRLTEDENVDEVNITLLTQDPVPDAEIFLTESLGSAIIDTACTRTVCGEKWLESYVNDLSQEQVYKLLKTENPSCRPFRFGDGNLVYSTRKMKLPAKIGQTRCNIETEVVKVDIPLLLSKSSLKKAGAILDMENDKVVMFKQPVPLEFTSSGHYCVDIRDKDTRSHIKDIKDVVLTTTAEDETLIVTENMFPDEKRKVLLKLHKQFGHASADRLQKLIQSSGNKDKDCLTILQQIVHDCDICQRYSKTKPKPAVGLPLASEYNETVAVDLHQLEPNMWYLHIIDQFTRFSAGSIVKTKKSSEIINSFIHTWLSVHGPPRRVFSDNGGEFNNEEFRDMAENFNIETRTTAGYSPWSNGLLERHNQTLTDIILKVKRENGCDWQTALDWALMAKNCMHSVHGYSPHQLVFGQNPNLPSVLVDKLPALEGTTVSAQVGEHISALHASRKAFTEAECSERLRRALRKQLRPTDEKYETGDKVYYKRADSKEWKGPGVVIGQDGTVIFVRHGGILVRVHHSRLNKVHTHPQDELTVQDDVHRETSEKDAQNRVANAEQYDDTGVANRETGSTHSEQNTNNDNEQNCDSREFNTDEGVQPPVTQTEMEHNVCDNPSVLTASVKLRTGQTVTFLKRDESVLYRAKVLGRAGKATGQYKNWYNLQHIEPDDSEGQNEAVDMSGVHSLSIESEVMDADVLITKDISFDVAKQEEIKNWHDNNVFEEVEDAGQKCISTRWVCSLKETDKGIVPKARLVARGFEELNIQGLQKDSPTCASESLRLLLAVICQNHWKVHSMDIKSAFLQGMELSRDIHVRPPPEADSKGVLWKLKKCVYGLADASLYWYNKVKETILSTGGKVSKVDPAVFYWLDDQCNVTGVLACHVDDFLWAGSLNFSTNVIPQLKSAFRVGREEHDSFCYVGIDIVTVNGVVQMHQHSYIENLQPIHMQPARALQRDSPLKETEREQLRSKIGQILWVARQTRPDVMFDSCCLASNLKNATVQSIHDANKVIRKLKAEKVTLKFQHLGNNDALNLTVFSDASLGNLPDGGTQGGTLITLMGERGKFSPLCWQSKRIRRVVRSTLAGETLAMSDGIDNALFLATLFSELTTGTAELNAPSLVCVTDNHSLYDALKSTKQVTEKRLRLDISGIKELVHSEKIKKVLWSVTKAQLADCLTKKGASPLVLLKAFSEGLWYPT